MFSYIIRQERSASKQGPRSNLAVKMGTGLKLLEAADPCCILRDEPSSIQLALAYSIFPDLFVDQPDDFEQQLASAHTVGSDEVCHPGSAAMMSSPSTLCNLWWCTNEGDIARDPRCHVLLTADFRVGV